MRQLKLKNIADRAILSVQFEDLHNKVSMTEFEESKLQQEMACANSYLNEIKLQEQQAQAQGNEKLAIAHNKLAETKTEASEFVQKLAQQVEA